MSSISTAACGMRFCQSPPIRNDRQSSPDGCGDFTNAGSNPPESGSRRFSIAGFATIRARAERQSLAACDGERSARDLDRVPAGDVDLQLIIG
jgi:hypothetical protein